MINFTKVKEQHNNIIIVGSSPEAKNFKPHPDWTVIAVNDAIHITKNHTNYWFTLDPSEKNMMIMRNRRNYWGKFYVAVPETAGTPAAPNPRLRYKLPPFNHYLKRLSNPDNVLGAHFKLSEDPRYIHTGNSAYGALGLAYHMNPDNIIIIGVNGDKGRMRFDGTRCSGNIEHLPELFASAKDQLDAKYINVLNGNINSQIECFPKFNFAEEGYEAANTSASERARAQEEQIRKELGELYNRVKDC